MKILRFSIIYGVTTQVLTHSPDGWWNSNFHELERSPLYHGMMSSYIPKLKFVKEGAETLRDLFYTNFPSNTKVYLKIEKLDKVQLTYAQMFYGEIKLDTLIDNRTFVEVTVAEGTLASLMKMNLNVSYNFTLLITYLHNAYNTEYFKTPSDPTTLTKYGNINKIVREVFDAVSSNGKGFGITVSGITNPTAANGNYYPVSYYNGYVYFKHETQNYTLFQSATLMETDSVIIAGLLPDETATNYAWTHTDWVGVKCMWYSGTGGVGGTWTGLPVIVNIANTYGLDTTVLDAYEEYIVLTSGGDLLGYDRNLGALSFSLEDVYKSLRALFSVGMSIELVGGIETLKFLAIDSMYENALIENVGEITSGFQFKLWDEAINSVRIGYPSKTYRDADDTLEFNMESVYTVGEKIFNNEINLVSKFRADKAGIVDIGLGNNQDDDLFFVCIDYYPDDSRYGYKYGGARRVSDHDVEDGLAINTFISPWHCLYANRNLIASLSYAADGERYYLTPKGKDNDKKQSMANVADMMTAVDIASPPEVWISEREGILISAGTRIFYPFLFIFEASVSESFLTNYKAHEKGYITFALDGVEYSGYILKAKPKPIGKSTCQFTLISKADNDLTNLIR